MLGYVFIILLAPSAVAAADTPPPVQEVVAVRSPRNEAVRVAETSLAEIPQPELELERPTHPNEIFDRVPGAWIVRASGQEHLTAVRSPVFTGPGACGAFLVLENKVPIRPAGFCNVNELLEVNLSQAAAIEVLRGPGTIVHGGNALHGAILVESLDPSSRNGELAFGLELGADSYRRASLSTAAEQFMLAMDYTDAGSFREEEGFRHGFGNIGWRTTMANPEVMTSLSGADLSQETAGFILGKDAYRDPAMRRQNLNPDAFRDARAVRLVSNWRWLAPADGAYEWIPYLRSSDMRFLQHFLPGTPLERNGQDSAGMLFSWSGKRGWSAGADLEWAHIYLTEFQAEPVDSGSAFLAETRPQGYHYAYEVTTNNYAAWLRKSLNIQDNLTVTIGIRGEVSAYEYRNGMLDGNTRDDGSECGFGGCLYTRPASRSDRFGEIAPEAGLRWDLGDERTAHIRLTRGFRAPQVTELYRLQSGQAVADLDAVTLDAVEAGFRQVSERWRYSLTAYHMRKKRFIFRDAEGFNVSDGKSRHTGVEFDMERRLTTRLRVSANLSWSDHEYAFDRSIARGELIRDGNRMDTAPEWLGALRLDWRWHPGRIVEAEWLYQGGYFLDAANLHAYGGHRLLNLRARLELPGGRHVLSIRFNNVLDQTYAERADYAFGNYRYFPGAGRRLFLGWEYRR
jgi:outer membrane receptor protein involved in Fe transport